MCIEAKVYGVVCFGMGLTLCEGNIEYLYEQLDRLFPHLKEKYMQIYGNRYMVESLNGKHLIRSAARVESCITTSGYFSICEPLRKRLSLSS